MASMMKLIDENGNAITAQQAYDAAMSGPVHAIACSESISDTITCNYMSTLSLFAVFKESENVVSVVFTGTLNGLTYTFFAGENPDSLIQYS